MVSNYKSSLLKPMLTEEDSMLTARVIQTDEKTKDVKQEVRSAPASSSRGPARVERTQCGAYGAAPGVRMQRITPLTSYSCLQRDKERNDAIAVASLRNSSLQRIRARNEAIAEAAVEEDGKDRNAHAGIPVAAPVMAEVVEEEEARERKVQEMESGLSYINIGMTVFESQLQLQRVYYAERMTSIERRKNEEIQKLEEQIKRRNQTISEMEQSKLVELSLARKEAEDNKKEIRTLKAMIQLVCGEVSSKNKDLHMARKEIANLKELLNNIEL